MISSLPSGAHALTDHSTPLPSLSSIHGSDGSTCEKVCQFVYEVTMATELKRLNFLSIGECYREKIECFFCYCVTMETEITLLNLYSVLTPTISNNILLINRYVKMLLDNCFILSIKII